MKEFLGIILKTLIFFIGWAVILPLFPEFNHINQPAYMRLWWEMIPLIAIVLLTVIFIVIVERGKIKVPVALNFLKNIFEGLLIGIIWLGAVYVVLLWTGVMSIDGRNVVNDIWIWILASLINVMMQELLVRGYLYQLWKQKYHMVTAMVITTILFTVMHGGAFEAGLIPVLNIVTMSIFMTLLLEYTGTIVAPIIAHFIWNTVGGIIFGGVSLAEDYPVLFNTVYKGNELISGDAYKIEGSIVVLIIHAIFIVILAVLNYKKKANRFQNI